MFKGSNNSELLVQALVVEVEAACNYLKPKIKAVPIQEERVPPADHVGTLINEIK